MDGLRQRSSRLRAAQGKAGTQDEAEPHACDVPAGPVEDGVAQFKQLARTIERDIVPRLVLAHGSATSRFDGQDSGIVESDVVKFAQSVLVSDVEVVLSYVERVRARGVTLERVYLDLLAPAARYLGDLWNADLCDFTAVTVGLWRLQQVVRELSPAFQDKAERRNRQHVILLSSVPGEQHTLGISMVAEFFRRTGWDVWAANPVSINELIGIVRSEWFGIIGLSVSSECKVEGLAGTIHSLRRASRNRSIGIMVGGPVFIEHPELVPLVGADATAVDGKQACEQAEGLLALFSRRC